MKDVRRRCVDLCVRQDMISKWATNLDRMVTQSEFMSSIGLDLESDHIFGMYWQARMCYLVKLDENWCNWLGIPLGKNTVELYSRLYKLCTIKNRVKECQLLEAFTTEIVSFYFQYMWTYFRNLGEYYRSRLVPHQDVTAIAEKLQKHNTDMLKL